MRLCGLYENMVNLNERNKWGRKRRKTELYLLIIRIFEYDSRSGELSHAQQVISTMLKRRRHNVCVSVCDTTADDQYN